MAASVSPEGPLSLLGITIRRSIIVGRVFLIYGTVMSSLLGIGLGFSSSMGFSAGFPIIAPIFGVTGSMGALSVFSGDRMKGVLEYLMAYGVSPRRIFLNVLVASLVLISIVLGVALMVGLTVFLVRGNSPSDVLLPLLLFYTLPMGYASAAFAATMGMYWSALSSPRQGMNSPVGLAPLIGILPSVVTIGAIVVLGVFGMASSSSFILVTSVSLVLITAIVVTLMGRIGRFLRRERLLSPT